MVVPPSAPLRGPCDLGRNLSFSAPFALECSAQRTLWDGNGERATPPFPCESSYLVAWLYLNGPGIAQMK